MKDDYTDSLAEPHEDFEELESTKMRENLITGKIPQ